MIRLAYRKDREANPDAVLIPGGKLGVWIAGGLGFVVVIGGIVLVADSAGRSGEQMDV